MDCSAAAHDHRWWMRWQVVTNITNTQITVCWCIFLWNHDVTDFTVWISWGLCWKYIVFILIYRVSHPDSARSLDDQLSFAANNSATTCSSSFICRKIRRVPPFLTQEAVKVLVQAFDISHLDDCIYLLAGVPACAIQPLQIIQKAATQPVFNLPKFSHTTSFVRTLPWLLSGGCLNPNQDTGLAYCNKNA